MFPAFDNHINGRKIAHEQATLPDLLRGVIQEGRNETDALGEW